MEELNLEVCEDQNPEIETYLSKSIISYGIEQLQGKEPRKLFCCYRNTEKEIVGAVMGSATLNMFYISHIYVEEKQRNKGIGSKLLSIIESSAKNRGCNIMRLNTFNTKAHSFYSNAGFEKTICIPSYMNGFDLVYYHKEISD